MYYRSIQLLRAVGAIYVCLYHILFWWNQGKGPATGLFDHGNAGVDLFFVISGFVIFQSSQKSMHGIRECLLFLKKRLIRIYPIYWIMLLAFLILGLLKYSNSDFFTFLATFLILPGHKPILIISWTLQYELYFYALVSLYILIPRFKWLLFLLALACLLSLLVGGDAIGGYRLPPSGIFNLFVFEFLLGALCLYAAGKVPIPIALLLLVTGLVVYFFPGIPFHSRALTYAIPSGCMIVGFTNLEAKGKIRIPQWVVLLGDASYCLYLINQPILYSILPSPSSSVPVSRIVLLLLVVAVILLSLPIYLFIDKPVRNYLTRHLFKGLDPSASGGSRPNQGR